MNIELGKRLFANFKEIFGYNKFSREFDSEESILSWCERWARCLSNQPMQSLKKALEYCELNLEWPPTIAEFISLCEKASGAPDCEEAMRLALKQDFSHPLVKATYDKLGSFAMRNDKEEVLTKKFKTAYEDCLRDFRKNTVEQKALAAPIETKKLEHENVVRFTIPSNDEWQTDDFQNELWKNKMLYMQNRVRVYATHGARGVALDRYHGVTDAQPEINIKPKANNVSKINNSAVKPISAILPGLKNMERQQPLENIS